MPFSHFAPNAATHQGTGRTPAQVEGMSSYEKAKVVHALRDIALFLQLKGENAYRCRAYEIAADRLAGLTEDLAVLASENRLQDLPGIGAPRAETINELVSTGR